MHDNYKLDEPAITIIIKKKHQTFRKTKANKTYYLQH